ncbi:unnamed protein product [Strongylus vulgaris]|uniref:Uncharacterized protein n=1 Tax=Strongylus vulgaris TaxID=40348 RepID=A0A3P7JFX5_STRVU|nr:unnamed protein product [Strongylus vulgaris]
MSHEAAIWLECLWWKELTHILPRQGAANGDLARVPFVEEAYTIPPRQKAAKLDLARVSFVEETSHSPTQEATKRRFG